MPSKKVGGLSHSRIGFNMDFKSEFLRGSKVHIDGDRDVAVVTAHLFRCNSAQVEVSWFAAGDLKTQWIEEWRLTMSKE